MCYVTVIMLRLSETRRPKRMTLAVRDMLTPIAALARSPKTAPGAGRIHHEESTSAA